MHWLGRSFSLVALFPAGRQAIHPTTGSCAKRTGSAGAAIVAVQEVLRAHLFALTEHCRAALLRTADRAVIAQKQIAVATINPALFAGTRCICSLSESAGKQQQKQDYWLPPTANQCNHSATPVGLYGQMISIFRQSQRLSRRMAAAT